MSGIIPLLGWDPTNPLVDWSCTCLSDAAITAAGGSWRAGASHDYHATYGGRLTAYGAGQDLYFDIGPYVTSNAAPNFQLSFDIQTDHLVAYLAGATLFNGPNEAPGDNFLLTTWSEGLIEGWYTFITRTSSFGITRGVDMAAAGSGAGAGHWRGGFSNLFKNFMTRVIIVRQGKTWQLYVEHQDTAGNRIGIPCLTECGEDSNGSVRGYGNSHVHTGAAASRGLRYMQWFAPGGTPPSSTPLNVYIRNIQFVPQAPTETSHPALRSVGGIGDSYASVLNTHSGVPNPAKNNTGSVGVAIGDYTGGDTSPMVQAMGRIRHRTGILNINVMTLQFGGSTFLVYGPNRDLNGTANPYTHYLNTDYLTPCGSGAANVTQVARANSTAYTLGTYLVPATANGWVYCVSAVTTGTSAAAPPTYPTTQNATVVDGGITLKCMNYDHNFSVSGFRRKKYYTPSTLFIYDGFNDADYIQRNYDGSVNSGVYSGYSYADYGAMFEDLMRKWVRSLLDQYQELKIVLITIPVAPNANQVNAIVTAAGKVPAINKINLTYKEMPAYFATLTPTYAWASYQGRVHCVDYARMTGRTSLSVATTADFSDGTHPSSKYMMDTMRDAIVIGTELAMYSKTNQLN